jgi:arylsulfatase A
MLGKKLPDNAGEDSESFFDALRGTKETAPRVPMVHHGSQGRYAIREGKWKLVMEDARKNKRELYDLNADPRETKNLISDHSDIERQLAEKLTALINRGRSTPGKSQKNDTPHWRDLVWIKE